MKHWTENTEQTPIRGRTVVLAVDMPFLFVIRHHRVTYSQVR